MTSYLDWHVGDRVVCVDGSPYRFNQGEEVPLEGNPYTIRQLSVDDGDVVLWLVEIVNLPKRYRQGYLEAGFVAARFRKVQARKTDISCFTALLNTQDELVEVPFS